MPPATIDEKLPVSQQGRRPVRALPGYGEIRAMWRVVERAESHR